MRFVRLAPLLCLALACSKSAKAPATDSAAQETPAATVSTDKPRLTLATGALKVDDRGTRELQATAISRDARAGYVLFSAAADLPPEGMRLSVLGDQYGVAAHGVTEPADVYVRFPGKTLPPAFDVAWESTLQDGRVAANGVYHVVVPKNAKAVKTLPTELFSGLASALEMTANRVSGVDSFYAYAAERLRATGSGTRRSANDAFVNDIDETMAMYTGAASMRDALQTNRALGMRPKGKRTVAIGAVEPLKLPEHPWEKLSRELGAKPVIEPLANVVPAGMLYLHASSAKALHATVDSLTDRFVGIVQASGIDSGGGDIVKRYADQLGLESSPAMSVLADTAIDGIAVASSDPFYREGTDVTVAFHVTNAALLKTGLAHKVEELKTRFATTSSTYKLGAHDVMLTASADGAVNRHQLELGDVILVSNSRAALERFVAVTDKGAPSLAKGGDFGYLRALYPFNTADEDAFAFIGDAFVARVTSPAFKVAAARRVQAYADVRAVSNAAMLYAWLEGHPPASADDLVKTQALDKAGLAHEGGEPIAFDAASGAHSRSTTGFMKPILETAVDKVTPEERDAYASFRREYEFVWSKYIDPAALRVVTRGGATTLDVRMLPITNRGDYSDIESLAGPARIAAPAIRDGVAWTGAVGPEASLRRELEGTAKSFMGGDFSLGWLGTWVTVGAMDRAGLYDLTVASGALGAPQEDPDAERMGFIPPLWRTALQHAPVYVGAEVKNPVALAAILTGAHRMVDEAAPGLVEWTTEEPIDGQPVSVIREAGGIAADQAIAIRYAVANGAFMASLSRETLVAQLAAMKEGRGPKAAALEKKSVPSTKGLDNSAQASLDYAAGDWLTKIASAFVEHAKQVADERDRYAERAVAPYLRGKTDPDERTRISAALLGYAPKRHDVSATETVARLRHINARVAIEGVGEHRGLHTAVTLGE